ncbi:MAG: alpha/beta hydrolase family protein [Hyphomonadaceae bacterium]
MKLFRSFCGAVLAAVALTGAEAAAQPAPAPYVTSDANVSVGDFSLAVRLYAPAGREHYPLVVLMPGAGLDRTAVGAYTEAHARAFAERGIATLAYDKRGTGQSGGEFTNGDFQGMGADAAALVRHAQALPQVEDVGLWALSQSAWPVPYTLRHSSNVRFAILVSPPGVNPHEQVSFFLYRQALTWGLSPEEAAEADRMHREVSLYYAGRNSHQRAQEAVNAFRDRRWFRGVVTHPYWDEMTPEGVILTPDQLAAAIRERPRAFELVRTESSFADYTRDYRQLRRLPTLIIYGSEDQLLPIDRSQVMMEAALRNERRHRHDFRVFEGADHDIQTPEGRIYPEYLTLIADWARARFDD